MERVSDERLDDLILKHRRWFGVIEKDVSSALTELRERREAEKKDECSICHKPFSHVH